MTKVHSRPATVYFLAALLGACGPTVEIRDGADLAPAAAAINSACGANVVRLVDDCADCITVRRTSPGGLLGMYRYNGEIDLAPWMVGDELQLVGAHELGHALGLKHSADPGDIMYPLLVREPLSRAAAQIAAKVCQ